MLPGWHWRHYVLDQLIAEFFEADVDEEGERGKEMMEHLLGVRIVDVALEVRLRTW